MSHLTDKSSVKTHGKTADVYQASSSVIKIEHGFKVLVFAFVGLG